MGQTLLKSELAGRLSEEIHQAQRCFDLAASFLSHKDGCDMEADMDRIEAYAAAMMRRRETIKAKVCQAFLDKHPGCFDGDQ